MSTDRTYWHVPGARSWHAGVSENYAEALCGRTTVIPTERIQFADRIPPNAHLCGSCARVIAARTDVEQPAWHDFSKWEPGVNTLDIP